MGYPIEFFEESAFAHFLCALCQNVAENAWGCPQDHLFCEECLAEYIQPEGGQLQVQGTEFLCPMERVDCTARPKLSVRGFLDDCRVRCPLGEGEKKETKRSRSCEWSGK